MSCCSAIGILLLLSKSSLTCERVYPRPLGFLSSPSLLGNKDRAKNGKDILKYFSRSEAITEKRRIR